MDLNKLIADYGKLTHDQQRAALYNKVNEVLPTMVNSRIRYADGTTYEGLNLLVDIITTVMGADGVIQSSSIDFLTDLIRQLIDNTHCAEMSAGMIGVGIIQRDSYQNGADELIDFIGKSNAKLKEDIVEVCLLVALLDGKVTDKEKALLARFLA